MERNDHGEIILYQSEDLLQIEVRLENETVWLTQQQIAELFGTQRPAITKHLKNIFVENELQENSVCSILEHTATDGKIYATKFYNLDAILSIGYRVNSKNATQFRIWANTILKEFLLKGYVLNQRMDRMEKKLLEHDQKFDLLIKTTLPPHEGIFYDGQIFDAHQFVSELVKSAKESIVVIDNYIDETVLTLLSKASQGVQTTIFTANLSKQLELDVKRFNAQYKPIELKIFAKSHDRFLILDQKTVYHIGASLKDLGKKWFAFSKMEMDAKEIIMKIEK
jgi:hypothetical protein